MPAKPKPGLQPADRPQASDELPDDALETVDAEGQGSSWYDKDKDEAKPLPADTDLSADDRLVRLENKVKRLERALYAKDSAHAAHHLRLGGSGYSLRRKDRGDDEWVETLGSSWW